MRGFHVPSQSDDYWECARIVQEKSDSNTFLEWLLLGPDRNVKLHLLLPTQFGIFLNKQRTERVATIVKQNPGKSSILLKQHDCASHCVKCNTKLKEDENKPYQVVLRIASGQSLDETWNYDFLFCFFCFTCQTTKTCALLKTSDVIFEALSVCISRYGFVHAFDSPEKQYDLMDAYLERFILLNQYVRSILEESMHTSKYCHHCGKQPKRLKPCAECGIVFFCSRGDCLQKATANNHQLHLCMALKEKHLFHVECALYVDATGERVVECSRYARI